MARQENFFALLGDGDDDVSTLIERVTIAVKADPQVEAEKKKKKNKKEMKNEKDKPVVKKEDSEWGIHNDAVSMRAKPIVLPDYGDCFFLLFIVLVFDFGFFFWLGFLIFLCVCVCVCVFGL